MKEPLTKQQLEESRKRLENEIEGINAFIKASSTPAFNVMANEIKKEMKNFIEMEQWTELKNAKAKLINLRDLERFLSGQSDLLEKKQDELEDIIYKLENFQMNLFEEHEDAPDAGDENEDTDENKPADVIPFPASIEPDETEEPVNTGFICQDREEIYTGDIYKKEQDNAEVIFYAVIQNEEGEFEIISNDFENGADMKIAECRELLEPPSVLIGNCYQESWNEDEAQFEAAKAGMNIIERTKRNDV